MPFWELLNLVSKTYKPLTHHYYHGGYVRAMYLSNGDILLVLFQRIWHKSGVQLSNSLLTGKWQRGLPKL